MNAIVELALGHWKRIALTIAISALAGWGYAMKLERNHVQSQFDSYQAEVKKQASIQQQKKAATETNWGNAATSISAAQQTQIQSIRSYYAKRELAYRTANMPPAAGGMPGQSSQTGAMPDNSVAPSRIDEIPANCIPLAEQCAETTQQLINLQEYNLDLIKGQVF